MQNLPRQPNADMAPNESEVPVWIDATGEAATAAACRLAGELGLKPSAARNALGRTALVVTADGVELRAPGLRPIRVDFVSGKLGFSRRRNRFSGLHRAVGTPPATQTVLDATAGLGQDAFLLALAGCIVTAVERSWVVAALLRDGLRRALADGQVAAALGGRLRVVVGDSRDVLRAIANRSDVVAALGGPGGVGGWGTSGAAVTVGVPTLGADVESGNRVGRVTVHRAVGDVVFGAVSPSSADAFAEDPTAEGGAVRAANGGLVASPREVGERPDVVYLDPMYPPRRKSAEVRKEMRVLRALVGDDPDAAELLTAARRVARRHVVVKRMRLAPELMPGVLRSYVGRTTRYDVYAAWDA